MLNILLDWKSYIIKKKKKALFKYFNIYWIYFDLSADGEQFEGWDKESKYGGIFCR